MHSRYKQKPTNADKHFIDSKFITSEEFCSSINSYCISVVEEAVEVEEQNKGKPTNSSTS